MQSCLDQCAPGIDAAGDAFADATRRAQSDHRAGWIRAVLVLDRRLQRLQLLSVHGVLPVRMSSVADRLWMRPKPATKRASRGVIFQKEKSASWKLIACSGKRASQASLGPPEICVASPRML